MQQGLQPRQSFFAPPVTGTPCPTTLPTPPPLALGITVALPTPLPPCRRYASTAAPIRIEQHNVFMPTPRHRGQYDRVHVGASCPPDRLQPLVQLLRPEGGMIVVPVSPNDLRVITKKPNGAVTQKVGPQAASAEAWVKS